MDTPLKQKLASLASRFAEDVVGAIASAVAETLDGDRQARRSGRPPGRRPAARAPRAVARSADEIGRAADRIVAVVGRHPGGIRAEDLRAELGFTRSEILRPTALLLESRRLKKTGHKRRTVYSLAGKGAAAPRATAPAAKAAVGKKRRPARPAKPSR